MGIMVAKIVDVKTFDEEGLPIISCPFCGTKVLYYVKKKKKSNAPPPQDPKELDPEMAKELLWCNLLLECGVDCLRFSMHKLLYGLLGRRAENRNTQPPITVCSLRHEQIFISDELPRVIRALMGYS